MQQADQQESWKCLALLKAHCKIKILGHKQKSDDDIKNVGEY